MKMISPDYKDNLIDKIKSIEDKEVIDEIHRLLDIDFKETVYITSEEQKKEISIAKKQIDDGLGIISKKADYEIEKWLNK